MKEPVVLKEDGGGLVLVVSEEEPFENQLEHCREKICEQFPRIRESQVAVNLGWREVDAAALERLSALLLQFGLEISGIVSYSAVTRDSAESLGMKAIIGRLGIAEHHSRYLDGACPPAQSAAAAAEDGAETVLIKRTVPFGETLRIRGNAVILGNVDLGAEVSASGDIVVLGRARGQLHAGSGGNEHSSIVAMLLEAESISIAHLQILLSQFITVRPPGVVRAKMRGNSIVLEPYLPYGKSEVHP